MAVYDVTFYDFDPNSIFGNAGSTITFTGSLNRSGTAAITETSSGADGAALTDDQQNETATADVTINGNTSVASNVDAETVWTVQDTTTGEIFQIALFDVEDGSASGNYTLSEQPLVSGHTYEVLSRDMNSSASEQPFSYADYSDGIVEGTDGNDVIDNAYAGDPHGDQIDQAVTVESTMSWENLASDSSSIAGGVSTDINGVTVGITYVDHGPALSATISNETIYTKNGDFDADSSVKIFGDNSSGGGSDTASLTLDFSSTDGTMADEVSNVSFRISDLDVGSFIDTVTITAVDADGNPVAVTLTSEGAVDTSGETATGTASASGINAANADGAILVTIDGPVSSFTVTYSNEATGYQGVNISDVHFDAVYPDYDDTVVAGAGNDVIDAGLGNDVVYGDDGNDTITGGSGNDTLYGGAGNDTIYTGTGADIVEGGDGDDTVYFGGGDVVTGGDGDDTFIVDASQLDTNAITIIGSETGEDTGDVLDLNGLLVPGSVTYDIGDPESGYATLTDGTVIRFENIETLICFNRGTRIETPFGPRRIETLVQGDLVLTRDHGPQPLRWVGSRIVAATGRFAPIRIRKGALDNTSDLIVSPQHRMLIQGWRAEMLFGTTEVFAAAKHLLNDRTIVRQEGGLVEYFHLMFDAHEVIFAENAAAESFHPSDLSLTGIEDGARHELFSLFPDLRAMPTNHGPTARRCLKAHEARLMVA